MSKINFLEFFSKSDKVFQEFNLMTDIKKSVSMAAFDFEFFSKKCLKAISKYNF